MDDNRLVFNTIPEQFDKWRGRYSKELYDYILSECKMDETKSCLEIGPGTGQASNFTIEKGIDYTAIELGENFVNMMKNKFGIYNNFKIIHDDFEKYNFENDKYDLVYSAAAIQWIDQDIAYNKCRDMLKSGGYLAMFRTVGEYRTHNPKLADDIQKVYDNFFVTNTPYTRKFDYENGESYGLKYLGRKVFEGTRSFDADTYVEYLHTHSDHIGLKEEVKEKFYNGIHDAIIKHGNVLIANEKYVLDLYQK